MANRRNRVADSIKMLEPLVPSLSATDKDRAVITLSTLADDYEKSFRYSDAANTYTELEKRFGLLMDENERQRVSTRGCPVESAARIAAAVRRGERTFHCADPQRQSRTSRSIGRLRQVPRIADPRYRSKSLGDKRQPRTAAGSQALQCIGHVQRDCRDGGWQFAPR